MTMFMDPEQAVEGGDFPRGNLLITEAYYGTFAYVREGKPVLKGATVAKTARLQA